MGQAARLGPIAPVGVFLVVFLLYAPSFDALFAVLDFNHLDAIRSTDASSFFRHIFDPSNGGRTIIGTGDLYRPIYYTVFWFEYQSFGTDPLPYYVFNATLHAANAVLVYLLAKRLTESTLAAVAGAIIWGFHPQYGEAVAWVSSTTDLLLVFFGLMTVLCYARALELRDGSRAAMLAAAFCSMLFALGAKETGAVIAPILVGYHLLIGDRDLIRDRRVPWEMVPFVAVPLVYFPLRAALVGNLAAEGGNEIVSFEPFAHIHLLASYAAAPLVGTTTATHEFGVAQGAAGLAVLAAVVATAVLGSRREWWLVSWFFLAMAPVLIFPEVWLVGRYVYLPFVGIAILAGIGVGRVVDMIGVVTMRTIRVGAATAVLCGVMLWLGWLNVDYQGFLGSRGQEADAFLTALKETYPQIPEGSRLIVTDHPRSLSFAEDDGMMLRPAVRIAYEDDIAVITMRDLRKGVATASAQDVWYPAAVESESLDRGGAGP